MTEKIHLPDPSADRKLKIILIVAVGVFMVATAWNVATRITTQSGTTSSLKSTIDAAEQFCLAQAMQAKQDRVRAQNEKVLTQVALLQTYSAISFFSGKPGTEKTITEFESTLPELNHILQTTVILPVPDCKAEGTKLRSELPPG